MREEDDVNLHVTPAGAGEHLQEEPESSNGRRVSDLMGILGKLTELLKRSYHKVTTATCSDTP